MKKEGFDSLLRLDCFPTVKELERMTVEQLEAFTDSARKELEEMQDLVDERERYLKTLKNDGKH